jgi:WD40 repeat protein
MKQIGTGFLGITSLFTLLVLSASTMTLAAKQMAETPTPTPAPVVTEEYREITHIYPSPESDIGWIGWSAWSPDGTQLAVVDFPAVHIFNTNTWKNELTIPEASVSEVAWSPDGTQIAGVAGGDVESLYIWDSDTGDLLKHLTRPYDGPRSSMVTIFRLSWSPDGERIASDSWNLDVLIWDLRSDEVYVLGHHNPTGVGEIDWSPDAKQVVSGGGDNTIRVWNVATRENTVTVEGGAIVDWHPSTSKIVGIGPNGSVTVWDSNSGQELLTLKHGSTTPAVRWNFDGSMIATGGLDGTIKVWDGNTGELIATIDENAGLITSLCWHPNQNLLASTSYDGDLRVWQINNDAGGS